MALGQTAQAVDASALENETLSVRLARHAASISWDAVPKDVRAAFRRAFVDYLACVAAGLEQAPAVVAREYAAASNNAVSATVIGSSKRASVSDAAFANGTAAHALDFDDGHRPGSAHPGGVIFSTALALAETQGSDWKSFAEAAIAGYEVMLRIAASIHPTSAMTGWHNSAVAGVFGSAATAARLLDLDADQLANAFGIAGSFAGGLREYLYDGTDIKRLHLGKAARDGILCAELASRGLTGAKKVFEGKNGLFRALTGDAAKIDRLTQNLGTQWEIATVYFKPYPCCRHFQAAIDGALELRAEPKFDIDNIADIEIGLYGPGVPGHDHIVATTLLDAQMSAPCAIVTALVNGVPGVRHFAPEAFLPDNMQSLLSKCRVVVDPECDANYPAMRSATVKITLADGTVLDRRILNPKGEEDNPLGNEELAQKLMENAGPIWGTDLTSDIFNAIMSDAFMGRSVREFASTFLQSAASAIPPQ